MAAGPALPPALTQPGAEGRPWGRSPTRPQGGSSGPKARFGGGAAAGAAPLPPPLPQS